MIRKPVNSITTNDLRIYIAKSTVNCAKTTANNTTTILRTFFTWLYEEDIIEYNPAKKLKSIKTPKRMREALTSTELEELKNLRRKGGKNKWLKIGNVNIVIIPIL